VLPTAPTQAPTAALALGAASDRCAGVVTRSGAQLTLDGKPFRFLGTNSAYFMEPYFPEAEIAPILDFIGGTFPNAVLRLWVLPGWDLDRLERVLDAGARDGVRFLITLDDYYRGKSEHWFQSTFRMEYLPHVKAVVERFRRHPAVMGWELMNEPTCGPEGLSQSCLDAEYGWVKETSEAIKALDPCRPVSVGTTGYLWGSETDRDNFRRMHALPSVDLVSIHKQVGSEERDIVDIARELGKPWFFGEVYHRVYDDACRPIRVEMLGERADAVAADIRKSLDAGASGYLLWQYAAGPVDMGGRIQWFCGWYEYFRDDPTHARIRNTDWGLGR
jgi:mannan endo-1,4-beta-mannosidase